jgi:hypothetical protein
MLGVATIKCLLDIETSELGAFTVGHTFGTVFRGE